MVCGYGDQVGYETRRLQRPLIKARVLQIGANARLTRNNLLMHWVMLPICA